MLRSRCTHQCVQNMLSTICAVDIREGYKKIILLSIRSTSLFTEVQWTMRRQGNAEMALARPFFTSSFRPVWLYGNAQFRILGYHDIIIFHTAIPPPPSMKVLASKINSKPYGKTHSTEMSSKHWFCRI